ncbi:tetratricopeptide repeat protein, partial [Myxococcota bacterium]|nr:tetratricopeptide repeat protein [Myxococcota bacterium]
MKTMTVRVRLWFAIASLSISVLGFAGCSDRTAEYQEFFERGNVYQAEGRDSEAIIEYRNALQADPNQAAAHEALARSYLNKEQAEKAFWELAETVRLDPDNVEARLTYATMALAARQNDLLLEQAEAIVELEPDNPDGQLLLGQAYLVTGQSEKAEA